MDAPDFLRNGRALIVTFAIVALGSAAVTILAVGGGTAELAYGLVGGIIAAGIIIGSYLLGARSGQPHSHAVAVAGVVFGFLLLVGVLAELLVASDRLTTMEITLFIGGSFFAIFALVGLTHALAKVTSPS